jgi:hypothetical protein
VDALEEHFDVEFTDRMLARKTFSSIAQLAAAIAELRGEEAEVPAAAAAASSGLAPRGAACARPSSRSPRPRSPRGA